MLFRNRPELAPALLRESLGMKLPPYTEVRLESAELTDALPTEYRADLVVLLVHGKPVLGIIVEVQLQPDNQKRYSWPSYVANLRSRIRCECCVLVVSPSETTAKWAATPIHLGPGATLTPLVIGPTGVPIVTDADRARKNPELSVLSAMAHGRSAVETAVQIALGATAAISTLDEEKAALYSDLIEAALSEAARKALEVLPQDYQFQGPSYHKGRREGLSKGRREGLSEGQAMGEADAVLTVLEARGLEVTPEQRERILTCTDLDTAKSWVRKAVSIERVEQLFDD